MLQHTRVAVRCALWVGDKVLTHVDPHSKGSTPALWPFGGVVDGADEKGGGAYIAHLKKKFDAKEFEGELGRRDDNPTDLSFWMPSDNDVAFEQWLSENQAKLPIIATAAREIEEEFTDFEVPKPLIRAVQYGSFERHRIEGLIHTYTGKRSPNAVCYTYVVKCTVSRTVEEEIRGLVEAHEDLYLITRRDVPRSEKQRKYVGGVVNGKPEDILVPYSLGLLFKLTHATHSRSWEWVAWQKRIY